MLYTWILSNKIYIKRSGENSKAHFCQATSCFYSINNESRRGERGGVRRRRVTFAALPADTRSSRQSRPILGHLPGGLAGSLLRLNGGGGAHAAPPPLHTQHHHATWRLSHTRFSMFIFSRWTHPPTIPEFMIFFLFIFWLFKKKTI